MKEPQRIPLWFFLGVLCFLQSLGQLIGAGGRTAAAADAFHPGDDIVHILAFAQSADALQVAVAAADETQVMYFAVHDFEDNLTGAGAAGLVMMFHDNFLSVFVFYIIQQLVNPGKG